ncbi:class I SAM-dependent methyltransferase [Nocardia halotolerans]|uniref:Class I SAM-dependent methyltransferase n=1 Tax=Nocardia halotolerans TaxID=1755878 RepID=A0ABV8VMQ3_9NOCA
MTGPNDALKACCAQAYSRDAVALLLGDSYRPGGVGLTRHLAGALGIEAGDQVADIACGPGRTARLLAAEYAAQVEAIDLSAETVTTARATAEAAGLKHRIRFQVGDAESIPLPDNSIDTVLSECAFCLFPDKHAAAAEFARVLRPGGRVGITDVTVADAGLPPQWHTLTGWVSCVADARTLDDYTHILTESGLRVSLVETHDHVVADMLGQIRARVGLLAITSTDQLAAAGIDLALVRGYLDMAWQAHRDGLLGYALLIAEKATTTHR